MTSRPRIVFISHPYKNDPIGNLKRITEICRRIVEPNVLPLSPLHAFSFLKETENRARIMEFCFWLISLCDEVWVCGDWHKSEGCCQEIEWARQMGKPLVFLDENGTSQANS
ncbi:MAG: DUF4406 domain-containing protein [Phage 5P_2]|nr:MAG: DUF4406 domain-containing protein [Phage 5P_2]